MDAASVESRFAIEPPIPGKFSWNGAQLTFTPSTGLIADQSYKVTIRAGATSARGRSKSGSRKPTRFREDSPASKRGPSL
jgi:hypothetical protein